MHIHHQKCVSSRENRMKGRKWMFACGFLRSPRRCAPFLTAFQAREAKIPRSFLSAFGPLPCSCTAVVRSAPMAILSDGGVQEPHTRPFIPQILVGCHCLPDNGGRSWARPTSVFMGLTCWLEEEGGENTGK